MTQQIDKTIIIKAPRIGEPEMGIEIITNWQVGSPIVIKGFHHKKFENKGTVLQLY